MEKSKVKGRFLVIICKYGTNKNRLILCSDFFKRLEAKLKRFLLVVREQ